MDTANKRQTVLITGGRSLLGRRLTEFLRGRGYRIIWLTHDVNGGMDMCDETFYWDVETGVVAEHPLREADVVVHLAGASLHTERWTTARKREIIRSRLRSARILANALAKVEHHVHTIIYASSISYYDHRNVEGIAHEDEEAGRDFLSQTFSALEQEATDTAERLGVRTVVLRNGVILDPYAGVLPNLIKPVCFGLNTPLGSGQQMLNWIHQIDICRLYEHVIREKHLSGPFNAVAPTPVTNSQFMYALSTLYGKDHVRVPIHSTLLRLAIGEMSQLLLDSRPASADKIRATGFTYTYDEVNKALRACVPEK